MMRKIFFAASLILLVGCGGGGGLNSVTQGLTSLDRDADKIANTRGTAAAGETKFTGVYRFELPKVKLDCIALPAKKGILKAGLEGADVKLKCTQAGTQITCSSEELGATTNGFIQSDGTFGLAAKVEISDEDDSEGSFRATVTIKGKLATEGTTEGTLALGARRASNKGAACLGETSVKITRIQPGAATETAMASGVELEYSGNGLSGRRRFSESEIRTRDDRAGQAIGMRSGTEKATLYVDEKTSQIVGSLESAAGPIDLASSCVTESGHDEEIEFCCAKAGLKISGRVVTR